MNLCKKLFCCLCCLLVISCSDSRSEMKDTQGNSWNLSQLKGKWLVVNYWASWCPTCMEEIPELNNFYKNNQNNVLLVGVDFDNEPSIELDETIKRAHITFPVLAQDPATPWQLGDIEAIPTTFIINPQGQVVKKIVGGTTEEALADQLNELKKIQAS